MAINRGPWNALVDDDGSNLVGSIWNKAAIKTVLLDPTDAEIAAVAGTVVPVVAGTWTATDQSGAGLVFPLAAGMYRRIGSVMVMTLHMTYPATANAAPAQVSLPMPGTSQAGFYSSYGPQPLRFWANAGTVVLLVLDGPTGAQKTNAQLSGMNFVLHGQYFV